MAASPLPPPAQPYPWRVIAAALVAGLLLRLVFTVFFPNIEDDSLIYSDIANNLLRHGAYALSHPATHPTLIRLPGYPLFLAVVFRCFGNRYGPVFAFQIAFDLASCLLVAAFVCERLSIKAAKAALWLAVLCPFTANYVAIPMTETLSVFCVSLALFASGRLIPALNLRRPAGPAILLLAAALAGAILLRPDGVLLAAATLPAILWYTRPLTRATLLAMLCCGLLTLAPLVPWTIRNQARFHVFEPLAPRSATDPGTFVPHGYTRWTKTWFAEFASNEGFFWNGNETTLDPALLPSRAFDSPAQRRQTLSLIAAYNAACQPAPPAPAENDAPPPICRISPAQDRLFDQLATARFAAHPFTRRISQPLVRLADMWLRPRLEYLPLPLRWWQASEHPAATGFAAAYAALNAALLLAAIAGFLRTRVPLAGLMLAYIALRCALLLTLENAEPRYTLECFPFLFVAAAAALVKPSSTA